MSSVRELKSYKAFRYFCSKTGNGIWSLTNNPKFSGSKGCVKRCQKETAGRGKQFGVLEIILHLNIELLTLYMYSKNLNTIVFRMSDTVIRLIERRSVGDKYILVRSMPSPSPFPCWPLFLLFFLDWRDGGDLRLHVCSPSLFHLTPVLVQELLCDSQIHS